ncbi:CD109 antigen-like [Lucilia sericata]|uniref:CD109 antigen-like n=1 Tax=Lucilia sericata TaxID=13632 RepID=UPI0018A83D13|nr:CD109 antigen-like [Lucilia sericata]
MLNNREFYCRLKLVDKKLKLGKPVLIEVSSIISIPYLMYTIMGHASLIHTEHVKIPPYQNSYIIEIMPTLEMIPDSFIYVYYIHKGNLRYEEMHLSFPNEFENQISLSAPKQVKPGDEVTITINAQPKSYVSLLAVDLGVYLLDNTYDLYKDDIMSDLIHERSYSPMAAVLYPGIISGLLTLTNAHYPYQNQSVTVVSEVIVPTIHRFRQKFPETWIFDSFLINETTTKLTLSIPDTITTWRLTAFSNHDITGFGIVNGPTDITTIQTFYISLNLPNSVKRGEIVAIPITIFNYSNQSLDAEVVLDNNDKEFNFMELIKQVVQKSNDQQKQTKIVTILADNAKTVKFLIYPLQAGDINLRITATSSLNSDAVLQKLKVISEGIVKQRSQSLYLSVPSEEKFFSTLSLEMPVDIVPDTDYITFTVGGHYLIPTVENFNNLIPLATGSGDQNMVNIAPGILILQYLKANNKLSKEKDLVENLLSSIEVNYQQQLSFRHGNGGYSVFGMATDEEPSTWLTANVVRYLIKASQFVDIESNIIESALEYLVSQQKSNGEFLYTGYLLDSKHENAYGLTAFILMAFLENQTYVEQHQKTIEIGVKFLNSNLNNTNDIYVLTLMATALKRAKHQNADILINQLKSRANENNGLRWWSGNNQNLANDIEITAYAAIILLDTPGDHTSILKWLIKQRNAKGGFTSSHDTVVGLEALVKFYLESNEVANGEFHVNSNNILELQKHELPTTTHHIIFETEGNGASLIQLVQQYNIINDTEFRHFEIRPKAIYKNEKEINLKVCFIYQTESHMTNETSNLVIMEINLPSGFRSEAESSMSLRQNNIVQKIEITNLEATIILYLNKLQANGTYCLELPTYKIIEILKPKSAAIIMYDYYNLNRTNTKFYTL